MVGDMSTPKTDKVEKADFALLKVEFESLRRRTTALEADLVEVKRRQDEIDTQMNSVLESGVFDP